MPRACPRCGAKTRMWIPGRWWQARYECSGCGRRGWRPDILEILIALASVVRKFK